MGRLRSKAFGLSSVLIPLLALAAWAISVEIKSDGGTTRRMKIVGYDPVDLLSGHYLVFRYDLGEEKYCEDEPNRSEFCICTESSPQNQGIIVGSGSGECQILDKTCKLYIKGHCQYGSFLTSSERFYFPEAYSHVLARVPEGAQAEISIQKGGAIILKNIYVGSQDLLAWAKDRLNSGAVKP